MHTHHFESQLVLMRTNNPKPSRSELWRPIWIAAFVALAAAAYGATRGDVAAPAPARVTSSAGPTGLVTSFGRRTSHNGRYAAEVIAHSPVAIGAPQSWTVHVDARSHRVAHASVSARAWMPDVAQASTGAPAHVRYEGHGNYRIDSLTFSRPGWWNVALVIEAGRGTDSLAFNLVMPPPHP